MLAEADYSLQDTATAMSVTAVVDLFTRMLGAFITDCPRVDVRLIYAFAQLIYIVVPYGELCRTSCFIHTRSLTLRIWEGSFKHIKSVYSSLKLCKISHFQIENFTEHKK